MNHRISKRLFVTLGIPLLRLFFGCFYDRRHLSGRFFDASARGWGWALRGLFIQKVLGFNRNIRWPVAAFNSISNGENITFHADDINNFQAHGCYFQNFSGRIHIGRGTYIAPNVGLITSNHDVENVERHLPGRDIVIGEACWIGMNVVILPGVVLGPNTTVGAGAVVTSSFPDGHCVVAGVPARAIRQVKPLIG